MNKQEEQDLSFTYRSQTGAHTGNESGARASELREPEEQTLTSPRQCKAQTTDECKQLSTA